MNNKDKKRPASSGRPTRKYTKSVDINVNNCYSRSGKATTYFYMPIAQAQKVQEAKKLGVDPR